MTKQLGILYNKIREYSKEKLDSYFLKNPNIIYVKDSEGRTLLYYAVREGNLSLVHRLIMEGSSPIEPYNLGMTPLMLAAQYEQASILELLLEKAEYFLSDNDRAQIIAIAARGDAFNNLKYLLQNGYDSNAIWDDMPIVHFAGASGYVRGIELLHKYGADLNALDGEGRSVLRMASCYDFYDIVEYLLKNNVSSESDENPLIMACIYKQLNNVKLFIKYDYDINIRDEYGRTPLMHAISSGSYEIVKTLLDIGADYNITDNNNNGIDYFCRSIMKKDTREKMKKLLDDLLSTRSSQK